MPIPFLILGVEGLAPQFRQKWSNNYVFGMSDVHVTTGSQYRIIKYYRLTHFQHSLPKAYEAADLTSSFGEENESRMTD